MPGINRINLLSVFCSCVAHAAILGGCLFAGYRAPSVARVSTGHSAAMVVSLVAVRPATPAPAPRTMPPIRPAAAGGGIPTGVPVRAARWNATVAPASTAVAVSVPVAAAVATAIPSGAASQAALAAYQQQLYESIARNSRYPAEARRLHLSGVTQLAFRLDRAGTVLDSWIQESSGSELLDTAATDALTRAQPLPPIPAALPGRMDFVIELDSSVIQQVASGSAR